MSDLKNEDQPQARDGSSETPEAESVHPAVAAIRQRREALNNGNIQDLPKPAPTPDEALRPYRGGVHR